MRIDYKGVHALVKKIKKKYPGLSFEEICEKENIGVVYCPMGKHEESCKGFTNCTDRERVIVINSDLPDVLQLFIGYHELGHVLMEYQKGQVVFVDRGYLFGKNDESESLANAFCADYCIDDDLLEEHWIDSNGNFFDVAARLDVPHEILDFKIRVMNKNGCHYECPIHVRANFLRDFSYRDQRSFM